MIVMYLQYTQIGFIPNSRKNFSTKNKRISRHLFSNQLKVPDKNVILYNVFDLWFRGTRRRLHP